MPKTTVGDALWLKATHGDACSAHFMTAAAVRFPSGQRQESQKTTLERLSDT
jgi:hypothetical protein